jgi:sugar phosphate isomerase/epimerase
MALKIGIQTYSVRNNMAKDAIQTLRDVAEAGYHYVEFANHHAIEDDGIGFAQPAKEIKATLDEIGIQTAGCHVYPGVANNVVKGDETNDDYEEDYTKVNFDNIFRYQEILGNHNLSIAMALFNSRDEVLRKCEQFNKAGKYCHDHGFVLHYHNHYEIGQHFGDKTVFDLIAENTDPDYVAFQVDTFWAIRGGLDPVELFKKYGQRVRLLHQKDFSKEIQEPIRIFDFVDEKEVIDYTAFGKAVKPESFTEIGTGTIDIQRIIDAAEQYTKAEYMILEQDFSKYDEITSINISMNSFRKFRGVEF